MYIIKPPFIGISNSPASLALCLLLYAFCLLLYAFCLLLYASHQLLYASHQFFSPTCSLLLCAFATTLTTPNIPYNTTLTTPATLHTSLTTPPQPTQAAKWRCMSHLTPHTGGKVAVHVDSTFLDTDPPSVIGLWVRHCNKITVALRMRHAHACRHSLVNALCCHDHQSFHAFPA